MGADFVLDWDGEKSNEELRDSILHVSWFAFLNIWAAFEAMKKAYPKVDDERVYERGIYDGELNLYRRFVELIERLHTEGKNPRVVMVV
jgi:hypothetical protein